MCLFTSARTVAIVFARSAGSEAMYCAGVLTVDGGFMDSVSSRTECIPERLKTSQAAGAVSIAYVLAVRKHGVFCPFLKSSLEERAVGAFSASMAPAAFRGLQAWQSSWQR